MGVIAILYIWFDTDAFPEWASLFRLKFLKYQDYEETRRSPLGKSLIKTYTDFLLFKYSSSFFIKLITCPICFSAWVNIGALLVFYKYAGGISLIGINIIITWIGYYLVKITLQKLQQYA